MATPPEFLCPISMEVMTDPVLCEDGQTYERRHIMEWLRQSPTSPITRQPLSGTVHPNYALKAAIERWKSTSPPIPSAPFVEGVKTPPLAVNTPYMVTIDIPYTPPQMYPNYPSHETIIVPIQQIPQPPVRPQPSVRPQERPLSRKERMQILFCCLVIACSIVAVVLSYVGSEFAQNDHTDDDVY